MPKVSVIIPTYNSANYLPAAIESVLSQSFQDFEVIVIDDGSTDNTAMVVRDYEPRIRYFCQTNSGVSKARNRGIEESKGEYVAFLDSDDTWLTDKLEHQIRALNQNPDYRVCYTAFVCVDEHLKPINVCRSEFATVALEDLLCFGNVVGSICSVLAHRSLFDYSVRFDSNLSQCADWDMWVQLARQTELLYLDEVLVTYRQHTTNMSRNASLLEKDSQIVLEKAFSHPELKDVTRKKKRKAFGRNSMVLAGTYFHAGQYISFLRCATRAVCLHPGQALYLMAYPIRCLSRLRNRNNPEVV